MHFAKVVKKTEVLEGGVVECYLRLKNIEVPKGCRVSKPPVLLLDEHNGVDLATRRRCQVNEVVLIVRMQELMPDYWPEVEEKVDDFVRFAEGLMAEDEGPMVSSESDEPRIDSLLPGNDGMPGLRQG